MVLRPDAMCQVNSTNKISVVGAMVLLMVGKCTAEWAEDGASVVTDSCTTPGGIRKPRVSNNKVLRNMTKRLCLQNCPIRPRIAPVGHTQFS